MRTRAHLHYRDNAQQAAVDLDVALDDDGVGHERRAVGAEAQVRVSVLQLGRHQYRDSGSGQRHHHARHVLAEVFAERRRKRQFETRQRVDHDPGGVEAADLAEQQIRDFIQRQIGCPAVDQGDLTAVDQCRNGRRTDMGGTLFERRDYSGFAQPRPFGQECGGQQAFARPRWPGDEQRIALRQTAAQHVIEPRHSHRQPLDRQRSGGVRCRIERRDGKGWREHFDTGLGNTEGMQPRQCGLPAHFHDLYFADHGVAHDALP